MYFICTEAKGAHLIKNKEMESIWFHQFFENLQKTGKKTLMLSHQFMI